MLCLIPDGRILKSKKVSKIFTCGVDHVGIFRETGWEIGWIKHVVGIDGCRWGLMVRRGFFDSSFLRRGRCGRFNL
jgi:hypothetical protein